MKKITYFLLLAAFLASCAKDLDPILEPPTDVDKTGESVGVDSIYIILYK